MPLCKYPNVKNKKAIPFYNVPNVHTVQRVCLFTMHKAISLRAVGVGSAQHSSVGPAGQTALSHFTEEETKARCVGGWLRVSWSEVMKSGPEIQTS